MLIKRANEARVLVPVAVASPTRLGCGKRSVSKVVWTKASVVPSPLAPFAGEETGTESTDDLPVVTKLPPGRVRLRTYCSRCPGLCLGQGTLEMGLVTRIWKGEEGQAS